MGLTPNERENLVRWHPEDRRGHVESYFLKMNSTDGQRAFWIKFTLFAPRGGGEPVAEAWAIAFDASTKNHVAAKETYPVKAVDLGFHRFSLTFPHSALTTGATAGELATGEHRLCWDLAFTTGSEPLLPFPWPWMYSASLPKSKLVTPYPNERFEGSITVDGEKIAVERWRGMQGHNWGREHAFRYVWVHCNAFDGDPADTYFEGLSAQVKMGPLTTPFMTLICLRHLGQPILFQRPCHLLRTPVSLDYYRWTFDTHNEDWELRGELSAPREDFVGLYYKNPDSSMTHCLNSKIAHAELALTRRSSGEITRLCSTRSAALEIATRDPHHGVTMFV